VKQRSVKSSDEAKKKRREREYDVMQLSFILDVTMHVIQAPNTLKTVDHCNIPSTEYHEQPEDH
jgi:hypothetical protein